MAKNGKKTRRADGLSVLQRANGTWEARVMVGYNDNGNPKRKSFYAKTRTDALDLARRFKIQLDDGGFAPLGRDTILEDWLKKWLETYIEPHREPKTHSYYKTFVEKHINPVLGKVPIRKLTALQVQELMNAKSKKDMSPNFVRGLRATLRSAMNQAWKDGLVENNVAARVTPPKLEQKDPVSLTPEQAANFVKAMEGNHLENLFRFALATGIRIGEASGLRWVDVDFERGTVSITMQLQRIDKKMTLKSLKSKSSRRTLPLVGTALTALQQEKGRSVFDGFANPLGLVFLNHEGRPLDPKYVDERLKACLKKAGLPEFSFHKLRHTAATLMVAAGVELHHVMKQLGHSQIALTANLYAHHVSEAQVQAAETLDSVLKTGKVVKAKDEQKQGPDAEQSDDQPAE